jgi:hypothetical protein
MGQEMSSSYKPTRHLSKDSLVEGQLLPRWEGNHDTWVDTCPTYGKAGFLYKGAFAAHLFTQQSEREKERKRRKKKKRREKRKEKKGKEREKRKKEEKKKGRRERGKKKKNRRTSR